MARCSSDGNRELGLGFISHQDVGAGREEEKNGDGEEVGERGSLVQRGISVTLVIHTLCNRGVPCAHLGRLAVVLKLQQAAESPGGPGKTQGQLPSQSLIGSLGQGLRLHIFNKC